MPLTEHERGAYARAHPLHDRAALTALEAVLAHRRPPRWAGLQFVVTRIWDWLYFRWLERKARRRIPHG